jgi:hypothetical protein
MKRAVSRVAALAVLWTSATASPADTNEFKTDGPWAYMKRSTGAAAGPQYMATTASKEDDQAWLLLVCDEAERMNASIVRQEGFPYPLPASRMQVGLTVDNRSMLVAAAQVEAQLIVLEPQFARSLVPQLVGAESLVATVPGSSGEAHRFSFALQPSMRALRDIGLHCYHPST